jgi:hypothetical protein
MRPFRILVREAAALEKCRAPELAMRPGRLKPVKFVDRPRRLKLVRFRKSIALD